MRNKSIQIFKILLFFTLLIIPLFIIATQEIKVDPRSIERVCAQVITPAISPEGICKEFSNPCQVPENWKIVEKCPPVETPPPSSIACPLDVKICPDGSILTRIPPDCKFPPCPEKNQNSSSTSEINNAEIKVAPAPDLLSGICLELNEKLKSISQKALSATDGENQKLTEEIKKIKQELVNCQTINSDVPKISSPNEPAPTKQSRASIQIQNPCDEVKLIEEGIVELNKKINFIKESIKRGEAQENTLDHYYKELTFLNERLGKLNNACQQGNQPPEESPCLGLSQKETIYQELQERAKHLPANSPDVFTLQQKILTLGKEIQELKKKCRLVDIKETKIDSLLSLEKIYQTKVRETIETKSPEQILTELKKIEREKNQALKNFLVTALEIEIRKNDLIKNVKIKNQTITIDEEVVVGPKKIKIEISGEPTILDFNSSPPLITDVNVSTQIIGDTGLEIKNGKLFGNESKKEINISPSQAQIKIIRFSQDANWKVSSIEDNPIFGVRYKAINQRKAKFLGFLPIETTISQTAEIDATNGEIIKINKPWWSFLFY